MSHTDSFWKLFWIVVGILILLYAVFVVALAYFYNPAKTADAAAVGVIFDSSRDPFESARPPDKRPPFDGDTLYDEALQLSLADWSWGVSVNWMYTGAAYEGAHSMRVSFLQDWSGVRVQAQEIKIQGYDGITLAVYPREGLDDLYIELFDIYGNSLGKQSLGWYAPGGTLTQNAWNNIEIPFANLFPEGQDKRSISGFAISTVHPGVAYIDSVRLEESAPAHARWYEPKPKEWEPEKLAPPIPLPYSLDLTPAGFAQWRTVFGRFELTPTGVRTGPAAEKTTGSMSYIRGGQDWTDYSIDTLAYWGQTSSFSILVRYYDDANFVSCAFSNYNESVQIYSVHHGVSTQLGASPGLAIRADEPWKDAKAGASVSGDTVSCYVDGEKALSADIPDMPASGSAGIETWTKNTYDSPHILQEFTVKSL